MSQTINVIDHNGWHEIVLNRPERLNAFNEEMHLALRDAIAAAKDAGVRALMITGAGRGFCAGQDLSDRDPTAPAGAVDLGHTVRTFYNPLITSLREFDVPVICAVNGVAAGAGVSLALACDIVLASDTARFIQSFAKVGLIPDSGGSWQLAHRLGEARAKGLALTGGTLSAGQAEEWGLIWKTMPEAQLMQAARELADQMANGPTVGLGLTKRAIQAAATQDFAQHLDMEADMMRRCGQSKDYAEGVRTFLEKRPAKFEGQ